MGLQSFQISFNNPHGVYYSGQQLIGNVHVAVNEPKKARGKFISYHHDII
jgi:hypothetical protein